MLVSQPQQIQTELQTHVLIVVPTINFSSMFYSVLGEDRGDEYGYLEAGGLV